MVILLAELRLRILADLKQLKADISKLLKEKFKIGVGGIGGGDGESKEGKKQTGLLDTAVAKLALIWGMLKALQPLADLLKIIVSAIFLIIIKVLKALGVDIEKIPEFLQGLLEKATWGFAIIASFVKLQWEFFKTSIWPVLVKIWEWIKKIVKWAVGFVKKIIAVVREFIKDPLGFIKEKLVLLKDKLKEWLGKLKKKLILWLKVLWELIKEKWAKLKEWVKNLPRLIWVKLKEGFKWIKDKVIDVWNVIKSLPELIWERMSKLPGLIKDALVEGGKHMLGLGDFVVTDKGDVIKTDPKDTIIATKTPGALGGGGGNTFNFYGVTPQQMLDVIKRELAIDVRRSSRF